MLCVHEVLVKSDGIAQLLNSRLLCACIHRFSKIATDVMRGKLLHAKYASCLDVTSRHGSYDVIVASGTVATASALGGGGDLSTSLLLKYSSGGAYPDTDGAGHDVDASFTQQFLSHEIASGNLLHYEKLLGWVGSSRPRKSQRELHNKVLVVHCRFDVVTEEIVTKYARQNGMQIVNRTHMEAYYFLRKTPESIHLHASGRSAARVGTCLGSAD